MHERQTESSERSAGGIGPVASGFPLVPAVAAAALGFAFSWLVLTYGQPHEDAFILFKYARNLAEGQGIVYYPGGPHAEGATDFLWMLALAGLHKAGVDVAIGAAALNSLGAAVLAFVVARFVPVSTARRDHHGVAPTRTTLGDRAAHALRFLPLAFLFLGPALAGYWGFSATAYASVCVWLFATTLRSWIERRASMAIPVMALVLALFRPDGVLFGGTFALLGAIVAWRAGEWRPYARRCALVLVPALVYMAWRRVYFGLPLPLPLYVKGHFVGQFSWKGAFTRPEEALVGLGSNARWALAWDGPLPLLSGTAVLIAFAGREARRTLGAYVACLAPAVVLLAALMVAWQSQNIGARFQAPALALVFAGLFYWAGRTVAAGRPLVALLVTLAAVAPGVHGNVTNPRARIWNMRGYVDTFAVEMGHILPSERRIALTEAGRLSYWTSARVEDLVGLNTARTALRPADTAYLEELDPDVVLFYADPFDLRAALNVAPGDTSRPMIRIDCDTLQRGLRPAWRDEYEHPGGRYTSFVTPERTAAMTAMRFLCSRDDYEIWTVLHVGNYSHVWAFKKSLPELPGLLAALRIALEDTRHLSYREALAEQ